jgi:DNA-binding Lrp family transcriptional regulator
MRRAIQIIAGKETYANLTTFENIEQLNKTVRHYKDVIADMNIRQDVKRNLLTVIEYIKRYSCCFFGVSYKGKRKIAADLNMSDKTITRLCKRLESFGFIKQYAMKRSSDMQQTSNAIVIQPVPLKESESESVRQDSAKMSDQENNIFLKQNLINNINTYQPAAPKTFYYQFKSFIQNTIGENQSMTSRLFGVYKAHTAVLVRYGAYSKEFVEQAGYEALKTAVMATKNKKIRNLPGYFNGVLDQTLDRMVHEEAQQSLLEI